jgi:ubiquinone/menaquinone biosynthesis C-methylase UbiE
MSETWPGLADSGGLAGLCRGRATLLPMAGSGRHDSIRRSYDAVAEKYADGFRDELAYKPLDRALLTCLIEQTGEGAPIADLGCGPGHVSAWLASHGATAVGIDLSAGMIAVARRDYPGAEFRQGDFLELPAGDGEFGAAVALYSIIHLEPGELRRAFAEIHRVLRPSGLLLAAFHIGSEVRHVTDWLGHEVDVDFRFLDPAHVAAVMEAAGLGVEARLERASYPEENGTRRGYLLARRRS